MSLDGFAWVGPGLGKPGWEDGYAIGETSQQTTGIKLTPQPYREKIGAWRSVQLRGFPCLARRSTTVAAIRRDVPPPCPVARRAGLGSPDKTACEDFTCSRTVSRKSCKLLCRSNPAWAHPWENSFRHPMLRAESIQNSLKIDVVKESACASSVSRLHPSRDRRIRSAMIVRAIRIKKEDRDASKNAICQASGEDQRAGIRRCLSRRCADRNGRMGLFHHSAVSEVLHLAGWLMRTARKQARCCPKIPACDDKISDRDHDLDTTRR